MKINVSKHGNKFIVNFGGLNIMINENAGLMSISAILKKSGLTSSEIQVVMLKMFKIIAKEAE